MNKSGLFLVILILIIPSLFFYTACSDPGGEEEESIDFWAMDITDYSSYSLSAVLRAEGTYCKIYVESMQDISNSTAQNIADEFDNNIYSPITAAFGETSDVDSDGKITILILDIVDGYSGSGGYIGGYYTAYNLYNYPDSNKSDMIYIDNDPGDATDAYDIIAHELQHLINYNQKVLIQSGIQFDTWINEGLSSGAEYVYSGIISSSRINTYNADSLGYIEEGMSFETWFGELENYSTVYLFFQWLRLHASNGTNVYKEIIDQPEVDYIAVVDAINSRIGDLSSANWDEILRNWFSANAFQDSSGILGYEDVISLTIHPLAGKANSNWPLYAGEGIYVAISGDEAMTPDGYINYAGLNTATSSIVTSSLYSGNYLLCYNYEGTPASIDSDFETTAPLPNPNIVVKYSAQQMQMINEAIANEPESYPIDIIVGPGISELFDSIKKRVK